MERWQNKIAVITGASSGIGAATCIALAEKGMIAIGLARRLDKMETQVKSLISLDKQKNFHGLKCDVCDEQSVKQVFNSIEEDYGGVDVLVNNAGIYRKTELIAENNSESITKTVNTNILGVVWCTREAFKSMKRRNVDGHVVIISSVLSHSVPYMQHHHLNIYPATKHALSAMTEILRQEFFENHEKVKITAICPGVVNTELAECITDMPHLESQNVADAIVYCIQTPPRVQIYEMIIKPMGELF